MNKTMKKVFLVIVILILAGTALFAEKKSTYKIENIVGKATYEVSNGEWVDLKVGTVLAAEANISVGLNSTVTVSLDGKSVTIKPMKKGKIDDLFTASGSMSGVKVGSLVTSSDIADAAATKKATVTASSRASEAKADVEWDE